MILLRLDQEARHYNLGLKLYYQMAYKTSKNIVLANEPYFYKNKQTFVSRCTNQLWWYGVLLMLFFVMEFLQGSRMISDLE